MSEHSLLSLPQQHVAIKTAILSKRIAISNFTSKTWALTEFFPFNSSEKLSWGQKNISSKLHALMYKLPYSYSYDNITYCITLKF